MIKFQRATDDYVFRWAVHADRRKFPVGTVEISVWPSAQGGWSDISYLRVGRRATRGVDCRPFDDAEVVVDRRKDGSVAGVEFMGIMDWAHVPEFAAEARRDARHGHVLQAAFDTMMEAWAAVHFALAVSGIAAREGTDAERRSKLETLQGRLLVARPDLLRWRVGAGSMPVPLAV